jgi:hypothetical protein
MLGRLVLLEGQLRIRVQESTRRQKIRGQPVHLGLDTLLE